VWPPASDHSITPPPPGPPGAPRTTDKARATAALFLVLGALSAFAPAARAQGGPPLVTDDPGTPGPRRWEINLAVTVEHNSGESVYGLPLLDVNYGWGERIQLKFEIPWQRVTAGGEPSRSGLGNSLAGVKWRFHGSADAALALSIYPQLEFNNPTSSVRRGVAEPGTRLLLPLEVAGRWSAVTAGAELGYLLDDRAPDRIVAGLLLAYQPARIDLLAECHGDAAAELRDAGAICEIGGRGDLGTRFRWLAAAGHRIAGSAAQPDLRLYLGVQTRL
jgi:hypothetical protein